MVHIFIYSVQGNPGSVECGYYVMRYMKDIIIDSRHLMTKVNLYLIINFHNIYIVYYINLTNQIMYVTCY